MRLFALLVVHFFVTLARLLGPGGVRGVLAETMLVKHQLLVAERHRRRAPNLTTFDRFFAGLCSLFMNPGRIARIAVIFSPATLHRFHDALKRRKYRSLFSSANVPRRKPGPPGPSKEVIDAIVEMKRRNPRYGCPRIAQQISLAFGVEINKDVVRRVLAKHYRPPKGGSGPSWLTVIGHAKDSLRSVDLFRCESILLRTHWVMVVMDQFTRRIVGFAVQEDDVDGVALCRMFNRVLVGAGVLPRHLSTDNDPLYLFHQWGANLRILEIDEIKSVPYVPISHPFVERLIGTVRREYLDHVSFWNANDLERKLNSFATYYEKHRTHASLDGRTPAMTSGAAPMTIARFDEYVWQSHCGGLYELPAAA